MRPVRDYDLGWVIRLTLYVGDDVPGSYWSGLELHIGVVCACMPAIRALLGKVAPQIFTTLIARSTGKLSEGLGSKGLGSKGGGSGLESWKNRDQKNFVPLRDIKRSKSDDGQLPGTGSGEQILSQKGSQSSMNHLVEHDKEGGMLFDL